MNLDYLQKQRLGRLATVDIDGNPHVVPVGFRYNPETDTIDIGGHNIAQSKKWSDAGTHPRVAFVVDDVLPPWQPRSIDNPGRCRTAGTWGGGVWHTGSILKSFVFIRSKSLPGASMSKEAKP